MKKLILPLLCFILCLINSIGIAQTITCGFQRLFTIKPGMDKQAVLDTVAKSYKVRMVSDEIKKVAPYKGSGGDSILKESFVYKIDSSACFTGRDSRLQLDFADNKLYKVYISTDYHKPEYQEMIDNFNALRNTIKPYWKYERGIKFSGNDVAGFGYDYTKTKKVTLKTEKISLQHVDPQTNNPNGNYTLEILWANLENTRMETSNY